MFAVLLYVFSLKKEKTKEDNSVTDFLFQDIRDRYPEAADRLPDNLTNKSNSVAKNNWDGACLSFIYTYMHISTNDNFSVIDGK